MEDVLGGFFVRIEVAGDFFGFGGQAGHAGMVAGFAGGVQGVGGLGQFFFGAIQGFAFIGQRVVAHGLGRELFGGMRRNVLSAEEGAVTWL